MASPTNTHDHHGCDNSQGSLSSSSPSSPSRSGSHYQHEARRSTTAPVVLSSNLHEQPPSLIGLMQQHHGGLLLPFDDNSVTQGQAGEEGEERETLRSRDLRNNGGLAGGGGIQSCAPFRRPDIMTRAQKRRERDRIIGVLDEAMMIMEDSDELFFDCPRQDQIVGTRQSSGGAAAAAFRPSLDRSSRSPASGRRLQ
eukprot:CAMPEP_0119548926 /NCGR_PEP_ID=MMETSP1352-20130426/2740_1 /TAXON_ID=265584 /ORGANISM="Stauroneis constricta, Strain CCMP1120" /LENGTH=196 /DNA_ID=CAMNT_0007594337 /DNA_START=416 /DNA_END=1006 /DNA_ORIENTATION=+